MKDSAIPWTHHTFNPWTGCQKVSPGCRGCYAESWAKRYGMVQWGARAARHRTSEATWRQPLRWEAAIETRFITNKPGGLYHPGVAHDPVRVFFSLGDWLDPRVPSDWMADYLDLIARGRRLTWLLLTKRPEMFRAVVFNAKRAAVRRKLEVAGQIEAWLDGIPFRNVAVGISAEDKPRLDRRAPQALEIPARWRWWSLEPLLEPVAVGSDAKEMTDWIVVGGESGSRPRPMPLEALPRLAALCHCYRLPLYVKQDSGRLPNRQGRIPDHLWSIKQIPDWQPQRHLR